MASWPYNLPAYQRARRHVIARDPWCQTPGCPRPATQADHLLEVATILAMFGGDTKHPEAIRLATDPTAMVGACSYHNARRGQAFGQRRKQTRNRARSRARGQRR